MSLRGRPLPTVTAVVAVGTIAFTAIVFGIRTGYSHDLEFMAGAMLDLAERARDGHDLYRAPSLGPTAFVYSPGWFHAVGLVGHWVSIRTAAKIVACLSAFGTVGLIALLARRLGASAERTVECVALFAVGYAVSGGWYDLPRVDLFATLWLLLATYASSGKEPRPVSTGLALGLAIVCKQTLVVACIGFAARALALRRFRECGLMICALLIAPVVTVFAATPEARRWMLHYCFSVPRAHGIVWARTPLLAADFGAAFLLVTATFACAWVAVRDRLWASPLFAPLLGALASSVLSRLHVGGWPNVMTPWFVLGAVAAAHLPEGGRWGRAIDLAIICQLGLACSLIKNVVPRAEHRRDAEHLTALVHALERRGEVWVLGRGNLTTPRHAHSVALADTFRAGTPLPSDLRAVCENGTLAAIIVDDIDELFADPSDQWATVIARNYRIHARLETSIPLPTGYPAAPHWLLMPRALRFEGRPDLAIADLRRSAWQLKNDPPACYVDDIFDCDTWVARNPPHGH